MSAIEFQRAPTHTIANNREDSYFVNFFKFLVFAVLFPLILKASGKCGDETCRNVLFLSLRISISPYTFST